MSSLETIPEVSKIGYLTWWNFPKKAWLIIFAELCIISSLAVSLYVTYLNDVYFQAYANSLSPVLVPVLSVAFGISSASIATYLYLGMKRIRASHDSSFSVKSKTYRGKGAKHPTNPRSQQPKPADSPPPAKLRPLTPSRNHVQGQNSPPKDRDDQPPSPERKKQL